MATPSPGYSITVRVEAPTDPAATARLSGVVAEAGGAVTALDVAGDAAGNGATNGDAGPTTNGA